MPLVSPATFAPIQPLAAAISPSTFGMTPEQGAAGFLSAYAPTAIPPAGGAESAAVGRAGPGIPGYAGAPARASRYDTNVVSTAGGSGVASEDERNRRVAGLPQTYAEGGYVEPMLGRALGYAEGGIVSPGMQVPPEPGSAPNPQLFDAHMQDLLRKNPQIVQRVRQAIQQAMQSGELDPQELQQLAQYARACMQNPGMYPQIKAILEKQGVVPPGVLPPQYNQGLVSAVLIAAQAAQGADAGVAGTQQFAQGGQIRGPGTGTSDSIHTMNRATGTPVSVSNGEYIIPAHVVQAKGKDFFDALLRKYHNPGQNKA